MSPRSAAASNADDRVVALTPQFSAAPPPTDGPDATVHVLPGVRSGPPHPTLERIRHRVGLASTWSYRHPVGRAVSGVAGATAAALALKLGGGRNAAVWAGLLGPDISLFYGRGEILSCDKLDPSAVAMYNSLHDLRPGTLLAVLGTLTGNRTVAAGGLAWMAHIGIDRAQRYGFRAPDGTPWAYGVDDSAEAAS